ncbi:hypothetical protein LTS18_013379, partial [Coniosporium uncinatum]
TMMFFIWLAGGAAVFSRVESTYGGDGNEWSYVDALYFCDVTILTVGFGDLFPHDNIGRGLVFPYSVGGIISLGLMISSIHKFAGEISQDNVIKKHVERIRTRTFDRTVTNSMELERREALHELQLHSAETRKRTKSFSLRHATSAFDPIDRKETRRASRDRRRSSAASRRQIAPPPPPPRRAITIAERVTKRPRKPKLILLREEKDRFQAMRKIQQSTNKFKKWWALTLSVTAFGVLWAVGAVVFWQAEKDEQGMTYFQALYFCYVSLLTIGYGDLSPKSNAGRAFFLVWSLVAVPTMTILISDMGDTIISSFKRGTFTLADWTVLPKAGVWRIFLEKHPWLLDWVQTRAQKRERKKREREGIFVQHPDEIEVPGPDLDELGNQMDREDSNVDELDDAELARRLALAIRRTANDLKSETPKRYSYEEWVELTRLIRFTARGREDAMKEENEGGLIEWDWIGENSPMMANTSEPEFVLDRLCESLGRYMRRKDSGRQRGSGEKVEPRREDGDGRFEEEIRRENPHR